jgi:hypothetical protein
MDRWQIIIIAVVVGVIWWFAKRYFGKKKEDAKSSTIYMNVNSWFHQAQEAIAVMDSDIKKQRISDWDALSKEDKLKSTEEFMERIFGPEEFQKYTDEEKLQLGRANYLLRGS